MFMVQDSNKDIVLIYIFQWDSKSIVFYQNSFNIIISTMKNPRRKKYSHYITFLFYSILEKD